MTGEKICFPIGIIAFGGYLELFSICIGFEMKGITAGSFAN